VNPARGFDTEPAHSRLESQTLRSAVPFSTSALSRRLCRLVSGGQSRVPGRVLLDAGRRHVDDVLVRRLRQQIAAVRRHAGRVQRRPTQQRRSEDVRRHRSGRLHLGHDITQGLTRRSSSHRRRSDSINLLANCAKQS